MHTNVNFGGVSAVAPEVYGLSVLYCILSIHSSDVDDVLCVPRWLG
jgi:hypothetical protein